MACFTFSGFLEEGPCTEQEVVTTWADPWLVINGTLLLF